MVALAAPRPVSILRPAKTAARWDEETRGLDFLFRALGGQAPKREAMPAPGKSRPR